MARFKVVVTDYEYERLDIERAVLEPLDVEFVGGQCRSEDDVIRLAHDADAVLNQYAPVTERVIASLDRCKVISRYGVGVDTIDLAAATRRGIVVANCTDYCEDEVADHALALLLGAARKTVLLNGAVKSGTWNYKRAVPIARLRGRTLGLVGFGRIARNLAGKARALGLRIAACDPYVTAEEAAACGAELMELDALCHAADYLSVHAPLTAATRGLLGAAQFRRMKPEAIVVNTSRGPLIDEAALIDALREGRIAGAALDVLEREPIAPDNPLLAMEQVVLNPHAAWYSEESERELREKIARNAADALAGYYPAYVANPAVKEAAGLKERSKA